MAFERLDLKDYYCFGMMRRASIDWVDIAEESVTKGWKHVDVGALQSGMAQNVAGSYRKAVTLYFQDPDTDFKWTAAFDNDSALWELTMTDQPDVEILPEQKKEFFASEMMKQAASQAAKWMIRAKKVYEEVVEQHMETGELLEVDAVKLTAILSFLLDPRGYWTENLLKRKYRF